MAAKRINTHHIVILAALISFLGMTATFAGEAYFPFDVKSYSGISYITGGIGLDERKALSKMGKDYSLKLVFARTGGAYVAMVKVKIVDVEGRIIFTATSRGPWLYANLPSGDYTISATAEGDTLQKPIQINSKNPIEARFHW